MNCHLLLLPYFEFDHEQTPFCSLALQSFFAIKEMAQAPLNFLLYKKYHRSSQWLSFSGAHLFFVGVFIRLVDSRTNLVSCAMSRLGNMTCRLLGCFATHHEDGSRLLPRFYCRQLQSGIKHSNSNNVFKKEAIPLRNKKTLFDLLFDFSCCKGRRAKVW